MATCNSRCAFVSTGTIHKNLYRSVLVRYDAGVQITVRLKFFDFCSAITSQYSSLSSLVWSKAANSPLSHSSCVIWYGILSPMISPSFLELVSLFTTLLGWGITRNHLNGRFFSHNVTNFTWAFLTNADFKLGWGLCMLLSSSSGFFFLLVFVQ